MLDFRAGIIVRESTLVAPGHVVAFHNDGSGAFRLYDNDTLARSDGTYETRRADELISTYSPGHTIGIMESGSDLSVHIGGDGLTTLIHRRERVRRRVAEEDLPPPPKRHDDRPTGNRRKRTQGPTRAPSPKRRNPWER